VKLSRDAGYYFHAGNVASYQKVRDSSKMAIFSWMRASIEVGSDLVFGLGLEFLALDDRQVSKQVGNSKHRPSVPVKSRSSATLPLVGLLSQYMVFMLASGRPSLVRERASPVRYSHDAWLQGAS
jgi:hypothetical protein